MLWDPLLVWDDLDITNLNFIPLPYHNIVIRSWFCQKYSCHQLRFLLQEQCIADD